MKKPVVAAIFAHPDDEAFGPSGTLCQLSKTHDVYIFCATRGEAGNNHLTDSQGKTIGDIREEELRKSASIIGVKDVIMLGYIDGMLSNSIYHDIADKIIRYLDELQPKILLTYEPRGISGHLDHIAMSMITSYIFERTSYSIKLMYYCIDEDERKTIKDYFIYVPPGYSHQEINETFDIAPVWETVIKAMRAHASQAKDGENLIEKMKDLPKQEHFLIREK
jgi:LmbE family N-acetylglucosaminyl deacetylase